MAIAGTGGVGLWTIDGTRRLTRIDAHRDTVYAAAFTPDGRHLSTCSGDRTVRLWNLTDPAALRKVGGLPVSDTAVLGCAIGGGGRTLAVAVGGALSTWDVTDPTRPVELDRLPGHDGVVDTLSYSADGTLLASGGADACTQLWTTTDPTAPVRVGVTAAGDGVVAALAGAPDRPVLAALRNTDDNRQQVRLAPSADGPFTDLAPPPTACWSRCPRTDGPR